PSPENYTLSLHDALPILSTRSGVALSRMLLPIACCVVLGGTLSMVGSSPLIMLNDLLLSANQTLPSGAATLEPFDMFAVAPIGLDRKSTRLNSSHVKISY